MSETLLPSNATPQEIALDLATARVGAPAVPLRPLWNPATCPADILPWLAWTLSVDNWDSSWTEATKRAVVAAAVDVHRHKGTIGSVRRALLSSGYGGAIIIERYGRHIYDGTYDHDATIYHDEPDHWAEYRVLLEKPITNAQAVIVRAILATIAPLRCKLKVLDFSAVSNLYNGALLHDGTYNHGGA